MGNLNGSNVDTCSDVAGPSSSGLGDLSEASDRSFHFGSSSRSRTFTISPTSSATSRHLGFECEYNAHTAFRVVLRHYA